MKIRQRVMKILNVLKKGYKTLRKISEQTGASKSSVDRYLKALKERNCHPESWFWETEEGKHGCIFLCLQSYMILGLMVVLDLKN